METTSTSVSLPKFNGKGENWPKHKRSIIVACKTASADPYGLLPEMLDDEEFLKVTKEDKAQYAAYSHPGAEPTKPLVFASASDKRDFVATYDLWHKQNKIYSEHIKCLNKFKECFLGSLDEASQTSIDVTEYGVVNMKLSIMYTLVDKLFCTITPMVYERGIGALYVDYNPSAVSMRQHISNHVNCHSFALSSSDEEITKIEKVRLLRNSVAKCGYYQVAINEYDRKSKSIKEQTFTEFSLLLIQVDESLSQSKGTLVTTQSLGYTAEAAKTSINQTNEEDLEKRIAAAVTKSLKSNKAYTSTRKSNNRYCHTHGIEATHDSNMCKYPIEGHRNDATFANKLGGRETKWIKKSN